MRNGRYRWPAAPSGPEEAWVAGTLESLGEVRSVFDPLCGRGAVPYECGLRGIVCTAAEPDPFMRWISFARSYMFRGDAAEKAGYAWERVQDDVFWESETFVPADVPGSIGPEGQALDFLGRVRLQIDREGEEGINTLLRLALCQLIPMLTECGDFDDMKGLTAMAGCLDDVRQCINPQPKVMQNIHLCDPRDLPYGLVGSYDAQVSVLPPVGPSEDASRIAAMTQWIGFGDTDRRDDMSPGYPYGDIGRFVGRSRYGPDDAVPVLDEDVYTEYLAHWFGYIAETMHSAYRNLAGGAYGRFLVPDESFRGRNIPKAEILRDMMSGRGIECSVEGTGTERRIEFRKPR